MPGSAAPALRCGLQATRAKRQSLSTVIVDSTVLPKAIAHSTGSRLLKTRPETAQWLH